VFFLVKDICISSYSREAMFFLMTFSKLELQSYLIEKSRTLYNARLH